MVGTDPPIPLAWFRHAATWTLCLVAIAGCGRRSSVDLAPCSGVVTLDGKPVEGWAISFHPDSSGNTRGPASAGLTDQNGEFQLQAAGNRDGAIVGQHRVFLSPPPPWDGLSSTTPPKLAVAKVPTVYQRPETSGLVATVGPNRTNRFTFDLRSTAK